MLIKCEKCLKVHDKYYKCDSIKDNKKYKSDIEIKCNKFYSSRKWQIVREKALKENNYLCEICYQLDEIKLADSVHHIVKIRDD